MCYCRCAALVIYPLSVEQKIGRVNGIGSDLRANQLIDYFLTSMYFKSYREASAARVLRNSANHLSSFYSCLQVIFYLISTTTK